MSLNSILARGRAAAAARMTETGRVVRIGALADAVPDPDTGVVTAPETVIYAAADGSPAPGRVRPQSRVTAGGVNAGEQRSSDSLYIVGIPHTGAGIRAGDVWVTDSSPDPAVAVLRLRVVNVEDSSQRTERRMACELVEDRTP